MHSVSLHNPSGRRIGRTSLRKAQQLTLNGRGEFRSPGCFQFFADGSMVRGVPADITVSEPRVSEWDPEYKEGRAVLQPWPPGGYDRLCLSRAFA